MSLGSLFVQLRGNAPDEELESITGPIRKLERSLLKTVGFTGATHERLSLLLETGEQRSLVIKRFRVANDWTARRSGDQGGREAAMLAEPALAPIWSAFACPYQGFGAHDGEVVLVMQDLTSQLFPDVREPLSERQDDALLQALATLHAQFWESAVLELPWLARPQHYLGLLPQHFDVDPGLPQQFADTVKRGWAAALSRVPDDLRELLTASPLELATTWQSLPRTLLHGDAKVANFAILPDGRVAAFDWALIGAGPCTIDLGWYIAVNATRLSRSKEQTLARYRELLSERLAAPLADSLWDELVRVAIRNGARTLLWSKALALEADRPGARAEWNWWLDQLTAACL
jgi:hypothetical protein